MQMAAIDENEEVFVGVEEEHFSFEVQYVLLKFTHIFLKDSERFEEDSLCSLASETGSLNQKWRGWDTKTQNSHLLLSAGIKFLIRGVFKKEC